MAGNEYRIGDEFTLSGGAVQVAETSGLPVLPASCAAEEIFLVNG